jgi:hypothetical protein
MVGEYLSRAKVQEVEREVAQIQLASAAKKTQHRADAVPKPRMVSAMPLRLLRRACRQAGALRPAA